LFTGDEHKFAVHEHKFADGEHKFTAHKYKIDIFVTTGTMIRQKKKSARALWARADGRD
jgi:hypothetical protein